MQNGKDPVPSVHGLCDVLYERKLSRVFRTMLEGFLNRRGSQGLSIEK